MSFGLKNKKLIKKLLVLEFRNCDVKLLVLGAGPSFLLKERALRWVHVMKQA